MPKYESKLSSFLCRAFHNADESLEKEIIKYAKENPEFLSLMRKKLQQIAPIPEKRCVISASHKKYLTAILEKINGQD